MPLYPGIFSIPGLTPGAQPAFSSKGTLDSAGNTDGSALNVTPSYPDTLASGDLLLLAAPGRDDTTGSPVIALTSALETEGWALVGAFDHSNGGRATLVAWKISDGTETGAVSGGVDYTPGSGATSAALFGQIYRFTAADGFASTPFESLTTDGTQGGTELNAPTITPTDTNRLGLTVVGAGNDDTSLGLNGDVWTGASKTYTQTAFDDITGVGGGGSNDALIQIQEVDLADGAEVSGGSMSADAGDRWGIFGLALVPAGVAT